MTTPVEVLDSAQLVRIESVHRGFFYQHLYAVALILSSESLEATRIRCETDEDIEVVYPEKHVYIQVKTRSSPLVKSDISSALENFDSIRGAYETGERVGLPKFVIVSNVKLGPELAGEYSSPSWPEDCVIIRPESADQQAEDLGSVQLPGPFSDIDEEIAWCTSKAAEIPHSLLRPETLVWKLASFVQYLCTGPADHPDHSLELSDARKMFEQFVIQLQSFPDVPEAYRPHQNEPDIQAPRMRRLIIGHSGGGKTSWASQAAAHSESQIAYFDVSGLSDGSLGPSLARELSAKWLFDDPDSMAAAVMPGRSGVDSLRVVNSVVNTRAIDALVVIDNLHTASLSEMRTILDSCPAVRFLLLAQPWSGGQEIETLLNISSEPLEGWSNDTIAREFGENGMPINPGLAARIKALTGGLPLYVRNSVTQAGHPDFGSPEAMCDALERGEHTQATSQEALLSRSFSGISELARKSAAIIGIANTPLSTEIIARCLVKTLSVSESQVAAALRELGMYDLTKIDQNGRVALHDAFRILALTHRQDQGDEFERRAATVLRNELMDSGLLNSEPQLARLAIQLLPVTGDIQTVVDLATDEFFLEYGYGAEFTDLLEEFARDPEQPLKERFWALDGLTFADLTREDRRSAAARIRELEELIPDLPADLDAGMRLHVKKIQLASISSNPRLATKSFRSAMSTRDLSESLKRIVRYNYALALYRFREYRRSERLTTQLVMDYYDVIELDPMSIVAKSTAEVKELLGDNVEKRDDIKHLADSLTLFASAVNAQRQPSKLARLHALKFYEISGAISSLIRTGQDVVDEFISVLHDPVEARGFIETNLLRLVDHYRLLGQLIPVRAQYAVVLAYCSEAQLALDQLDGLEPYKASLPDGEQLELSQQRTLVEEINQGRHRLGPRR